MSLEAHSALDVEWDPERFKSFNRRRNRAPLEITADILRVARNGARRTAIMYRANLSFEQLKRYLNSLVHAGLLKSDGPNGPYRTAEAGLIFLKYYEEFIATYPDNERAYEAKFMIGFTLAEDLQDYDEAEKNFKEFLEQYPETDLSDDASGC